MDSCKRLKTELNGIKDIISSYTSRGDIINYLNQLENSLSNDDIEITLYCLENIVNWYSQNISNIYSNEYVFDKEEHRKNKALLETLYSEMKEHKLDYTQNMTEKNEKNKKPNKIFLSHSSSDTRYGNAIRDFLNGIGIKNNQIIYTSSPVNKIPFGKNIFDYLRENIDSNVFVIILLSNSYLESVACLNEMGGAWVAKSDYLCFFTPDFDFSNPKYHQCAIDTRKMGAVLKPGSNCRTSMIEFKNILCEQFNTKIEEKDFSYLLDTFLESIE